MQRLRGLPAYRYVDAVIDTDRAPGRREGTTGSMAFPEFFEREYPRLVRLMVPTTHDLAAAEEAAQEAMMRVFERWERVSQLESPVGYAYVTAVNASRRRFRRPWVTLSDELPDLKADPASLVVSRDRLLTALGRLSRVERDALLLVSVLGLSAEEAGRALKIKPASVRSRLHRARASLHEFEEG